MMSSVASPGNIIAAIFPNPKIIKRIKRYNTKAHPIPKNFPTKPKTIIETALQGINVARNPVINRSLWVSMMRQDRQ